MKAHTEKLVDVSDMQVPDEDDRHADLHNTMKANNKIVKERIWTLDSRFATEQQDCDGANLDQPGRQQD